MLERRWTFFPVKDPSDRPWQAPAGAETVAFPTADGSRLSGWFLRGEAPRNGITVLVLHGNLGILPNYLPDAEFLRRRGFDVLLFNYRGFGLSEGHTLGEATLDVDAMAALDYLVKQHGVDPQSIVLLGVSLGGAVAAQLATQSPCRAIVLVSASASAERQALYERPWLPRFILDNLSSRFDTVGRIGKAKCPVLVIHGGEDHVVPPDQARAIYRAARTPKQLVIVPHATHGMGNADGATYLEDLAGFVTRRW